MRIKSVVINDASHTTRGFINHDFLFAGCSGCVALRCVGFSETQFIHLSFWYLVADYLHTRMSNGSN